jgi:4-hydroxybutyryl-CoA dehydratase/vinylacetyl-CoA-Delta-isomerase
MPLKTKQEYFDTIKRLNTETYAFGERVKDVTEHPCFKPPMESIGLVYELSRMEEYEDLLTAYSLFTNGRVNRFLHIHQEQEDLRKRLVISRFYVHRHGACIGGRCVGSGVLNSLFAVTYEMDQELGTEYHSRFLEYLKYVQKKDLAVAGAMMDVKGDRSLRPHQQRDPDMYLRVVDRRKDGIVVRGAKASISGASIAHETVVLPCTSMEAEDQAYAVSFATRSDAPGLIHIAEAPAPSFGRFIGQEMDFGNVKYGVHGSAHIIFDDVFVPWERVFMCGEYRFTAKLVDYFTRLQRLATTGCKCGHRDLLIGASAVIADYNGVGDAGHIREKLTDLYFQSELSAGCALASVYNGEKTASGVYLPDPLYINIAKLQGVNAIWDGNYKMADIAGGLVCTAPTSKDMKHEKIGKFLTRYLKGRADVPTEHRIRMMRLIEYLSGQGSVIPIESTHGAGSPQAQRIVVQGSLMRNIERFKKAAKALAGVEEQADEPATP